MLAKWASERRVSGERTTCAKALGKPACILGTGGKRTWEEARQGSYGPCHQGPQDGQEFGFSLACIRTPPKAR